MTDYDEGRWRTAEVVEFDGKGGSKRTRKGSTLGKKIQASRCGIARKSSNVFLGTLCCKEELSCGRKKKAWKGEKN